MDASFAALSSAGEFSLSAAVTSATGGVVAGGGGGGGNGTAAGGFCGVSPALGDEIGEVAASGPALDAPQPILLVCLLYCCLEVMCVHGCPALQTMGDGLREGPPKDCSSLSR